MALLDIKGHAKELGFDLARVIPAGPARFHRALTDWLARGMHGEMAYLANRAEVRADARALAPGARSIVLLAANYNPGPPPTAWEDPARGRIARYAWSSDYHELIKARLFALDERIRQWSGRQSLGKACVDTAPFVERDFALQAGLGFIGKNTVLITPGVGSWTFLAALLVPEELDYDPAPAEEPPSEEDPAWRWRLMDASETWRTGTCGSCHRCLGACPTRAFAGPYVLDARRCISYLTIELRGPIPRELRPAMGNWVFGCDVCQEVCPYNRDASIGAWPSLASDAGRAAPPLLELLQLDEASFRDRFRGTAVLRTKRRGMVRNACVAAGNWGDDQAVPVLVRLLEDAEPLVRGHAAWALRRIGGPEALRALARASERETDAYVLQELGDERAADG